MAEQKLMWTERELVALIRADQPPATEGIPGEQLTQLHNAGKAVCCIETTDLDGIAKVNGTGFHLGRGWTVTNAHVVVDGLCLSNSVVTYQWMDADSKAERCRTFESQNRIGFISKHKDERDLAIFKLGVQYECGRKSDDYLEWETDECENIKDGAVIQRLDPEDFNPKWDANLGEFVTSRNAAPRSRPGQVVYHIFWKFEDGKTPEKVFAISKVVSDEVTTNFTFESPDADHGSSGSPVLSVGSGGLYLSGVMFRGKETGTTQLALSHSVCQKAFDTTIGLIDKSQTAQAYNALAGVLSEIEQVERCQGVFTDLVGKLEEGAEKEKLEIILHFPFLPVITPTRTTESREQTQETDDFVEKAKQWRFVSRVPEDVREVGREVVNYISNRSEACLPAKFTEFRNGEGYLPRCGKDKVYYEAQVGQDREGKRGKRRVVVLVANDDKVEAMYYTPSHYGPEHKDDVSKKARKLPFFKFR